MRKEDFVSTLVMTTVSILMLVGVTIAWYTAVYAHPTVTGMNMEAGEMGSIKIALEPGGEDIAVLQQDNIEGNEYAQIGLEELLNIEEGQMAPGAYGKVVFYVTSLNQDITSCRVVPSLMPGYEENFVADYEDGVVPENETVTINNSEKVINDVLEEHFDFYTDEDMTTPVNADSPMEVILIDETKDELKWDETNGIGQEVTVTIYWKWHYEDPTATADNPVNTDGTAMSAEDIENAIYDYDMEDTWIGTHLNTMSFHFDFMIEQ